MAKGNRQIYAWVKPAAPPRPWPPPPPEQCDCPECPDPSSDGNIQGTLQTVLSLKDPNGVTRPITSQNGGLPVQPMTNSAWPIWIQVTGTVSTSMAGSASGDLTGTYPGPTIKDGVILYGNSHVESIDTTTRQLFTGSGVATLDYSSGAGINFIIGAGSGAPSTNGFSTTATAYYGASFSPTLGNPNSWLGIKANGTNYKIPLYS